MDPVFSAPGDDFPDGRKKDIHSVGTVSKVRWVSQGSHPFTGIFKGGDYGILRLSTAAPPV